MQILALVVALILSGSHVLTQSDDAAGYLAMKAERERVLLSKVTDVVVIPVIEGKQPACRPSDGVLRTEAELVLRRSGIRAWSRGGEASGRPHGLYIGLIGVHLESFGLCAMAVNVTFQRAELLGDGAIGDVVVLRRGGVFTKRPNELEEYMRTTVNRIVTEIANNILLARQ